MRASRGQVERHYVCCALGCLPDNIFSGKLPFPVNNKTRVLFTLVVTGKSRFQPGSASFDQPTDRSRVWLRLLSHWVLFPWRANWQHCSRCRLPLHRLIWYWPREHVDIRILIAKPLKHTTNDAVDLPTRARALHIAPSRYAISSNFDK